MRLFTSKSEYVENGVKTVKYFLRGTPLLLIKKQWDVNYRRTIVLGITVRYHRAQDFSIKNTLDTQDLFITSHIHTAPAIDIIVPVYNGFDFLDNLFTSIKENTYLDYRLFVINDASPDERVLPLLKKYQTVFGQKMCLIDNRHNLGFLKSVNLALQKTTRHVVLVNTDVVLPKNWASKLLYPIAKDPKVASVTPLSNCATIFSVPSFGDNNFDGDMETVNQSLSCINTPFNRLHFPTGVGFCMAMNKYALEKIGGFDTIYERGYGEENDWCQRAIKKGFYNTIAANLFVWHKHGASFGSEKFKMIERHLQIIYKRHKNYQKSIHKIQQDETYLSLREFIKILYFNAIATDTLVWFCHDWGGGAEMYVQRQIEDLRQNSLCITFRCTRHGHIRMMWFYKKYSGSLYIKDYDIVNILHNIKIKSVLVNSLASWVDIPKTLEMISDIKRDSGCMVSFRGHDFIPICPAICMLNENNTYCNIDSLERCKRCKLQASNKMIPVNDLDDYHTAWLNFFTNTCDEIVVFSDSTKEIYNNLFPNISQKVKIIPHKISKMRSPVVPKHSGINIAVLGAINASKGLHILLEMDKLLKNYKNVTLTVIGYIPKSIKLNNIIQTGKYCPSDLPQVIEKYQIDLILIPSIWPETFSYTTQEAMEMNMKLACFNLGAQAERTKKYANGLVIDKIDAKYALEQIIEFCKGENNAEN